MNQETSIESGTNVGPTLLGDYLKQKRLDKNFSLEKLSQKTKISVNILKSLEANDFDHLPSAAYIKGFVTSYVKVLGIPLHEAIMNMEYTYQTLLGKPFPALNHTKLMNPAPSATRLQAGSQGQHEDPTPHEVIENSDSIIENTKSVLPVVILISVIVLFIGGYKVVSSIVENEVQNQKNSDLGPKIVSSSDLLKPNPHSDQPKKEDQSPTSEKTDTQASSDIKKEEVKPPQEFERNFPTIEFKKIKGKLFQVKTDAPENEDVNLLPDNIKRSANSSLQNVYIRAIEGNTWVSYKIDAQPIGSVIINKGGELYLQGSEIRLFLGNVNVTRIFYNNYIIETPTKSGVKTLIFPEESNSKYMQPLFPKAKDDILYTSEEYIKRMELEEEELKKRQEQQ
jgi:cytoskeletal protein RodZ